MEAWRLFRSLNRDQRNTFLACFLGWALDAFDFFLLTFVLPPVAHEFGRTIPQVAFAITLTLMMRPVGAVVFGYFGDRFGRRTPLMIDIVFYSLMELLTAVSPNFTVFLVLRALYGIGMGGEWGLGASLAMESLPTAARGLFSGILQQGYAFGYLIAAITYALIFPALGWRGLFLAGALPAALVIFIRMRVPESPVWQRQRDRIHLGASGIAVTVRRHWRLFLYAVFLMTAFNCMSHGTQDLYQTFLEKQRDYGVNLKATIGVIYSLGAICGGTLFGHLSQKWGRRRSIITAAGLGILMIPAWMFSPALPLLIAGGFGIQFMVQGAWGVVPVHLNELSPPEVRGIFPGFVYQLGNLFASSVAFYEAKLAEHFRDAAGHPDYAKSLALFALGIFLVLISLTAMGREARGIEF